MADAILNVRLKKAKITYHDRAVSKSLFKLPPSAIVLGFKVDVTEAFNGTGTDLLDLGISGTAQKYAAAVDLSSIDWVDVQQSGLGEGVANPVEIFGLVTDANSDESAGKATVYVLYATIFD